MAASSTTPAPTSFESAYEELGEIVNRLETGDLPLEETLKLYERGRALVTFCQTSIEVAELKISQLNGDGSNTPISGERFS